MQLEALPFTFRHSGRHAAGQMAVIDFESLAGDSRTPRFGTYRDFGACQGDWRRARVLGN
jgi:hypothetical protein